MITQPRRDRRARRRHPGADGDRGAAAAAERAVGGGRRNGCPPPRNAPTPAAHARECGDPRAGLSLPDPSFDCELCATRPGCGGLYLAVAIVRGSSVSSSGSPGSSGSSGSAGSIFASSRRRESGRSACAPVPWRRARCLSCPAGAPDPPARLARACCPPARCSQAASRSHPRTAAPRAPRALGPRSPSLGCHER